MSSTPVSIAREPSLPAGTHAEFRVRAATALLGVFLVCAILLTLRRGPWVDEVWTLWQSRHDLPLAEIVRQRWLADFHPPLFSLSHWLASVWAGESLLAHRLLNLLPLAWAGVFVVFAARRYPRSAAALLVYAVLLLSLPTAIEYFPESRSYFAQICTCFVVACGVIVILDSERDLDWRHDKPLAAMLAATIVVALNLHYISTLMVGLVLAGAIGLCAWRGQRRWALTLLAAAALGCASALLSLMAHASYLGADSGNYWVRSTQGEAVMILLRRVAAAARANPLASAVAAAAVLVTAARLLRVRWAADEPIFDTGFAARLQLSPARRAAVLMLGAALLIFGLAMLAAHLRQPIVTGRYLLGFQVVVLAVVACLAAEAVMHRRLLFVLLIAGALLSIVQQTSKTIGERRWDSTARIVSNLIAECTSSPVYTALVPSMIRLRNAQAAVRWGYEWQGRRYGFKVRHLDARNPAPPVATGSCPALVWVEHVGQPVPIHVEGALLRIGLDDSAIDTSAARLVVGETGFVLKLPPKP